MTKAFKRQIRSELIRDPQHMNTVYSLKTAHLFTAIRDVQAHGNRYLSKAYTISNFRPGGNSLGGVTILCQSQKQAVAKNLEHFGGG